MLLLLLILPVLGAKAAVVLTTLHSFGVFTNGASPNGLVQGSDGNLYGTTRLGGTSGSGTVFKISTNGALTSLYSFGSVQDANGVPHDGASPSAALVQGSDGNFYGTTQNGGTNGGCGTVFKISTNGTLTTLYSFSGGSDGANPNGLVQGSDGSFYGTTQYGGTNGAGTVFKISPNGALTTLYAFGTVTNANGQPLDGLNPMAALVQGSDGNFYGTTEFGGLFPPYSSGWGTVFRISTNGAFTSLYLFTGGDDGAYPNGLVQGSDGNFYGTTYNGGANNVKYGGDGTVFKISPNGALTSLYSFGLVQDTNGLPLDGANPQAALVQGSDGDFYGTTYDGGTNGLGTVFKISINGALTSLYSFTGGTNGATLNTALVQGRDGSFYGTTEFDDSGAGNFPSGCGTMFKITPNGAFTSLYSFTGINDGGSPNGLVQGSDGSFYGTTSGGGTNGAGTVFKISTNGVLTTLYAFGSITNASGVPLDGAGPNGLVQGSDGYFYGTTGGGGTRVGSYGVGTVFKISTNGALTTLYAFGSITNASGVPLDGAGPNGLVQGSDGYFYGTTGGGGTNGGNGTVFKISANGALTSLHSFAGGSDGSTPQAALVQGSDGYFYGTTSDGGTTDVGTVFKISTNGALTTLYSFTGGGLMAYGPVPLWCRAATAVSMARLLTAAT